mgnify:CR=1 FL=1
MTRTLTLKNRFQGNTTVVENDFIDNYITKANGEYVKVYLMLLRHLGAGSSLSISGLADCLECTEKDILRAFKYWTKVGLLKMDYDESGNICGSKSQLSLSFYHEKPFRKFLLKFLFEKVLCLAKLIGFAVGFEFFKDGLADSVHEKSHFRGVVHIKDVVKSELRTADNSVKCGKIGVMI